MKTLKRISTTTIASLLFWGLSSSCSPSSNDITVLEPGFKTPPDSVTLGVYWYWISDHISKEGVIKDLEAMKEVGIGRAQIGNIMNDGTPQGPVKFFSDDWWEITHAACKRATELGIELGMFNSPGWSQSGGPWIQPNESMRYLKTVEYQIEGGKTVELKLTKPTPDFDPVKILAFQTPEAEKQRLSTSNARITATPNIPGLNHLFDNDTTTTCLFQKNDKNELTIKTATPVEVRSLKLIPAKVPMEWKGRVFAKVNGSDQLVKEFSIHRSNIVTNVGFEPFAPIVLTFEAIKSDEFRLEMSEIRQPGGFSELIFTPAALTERFAEKQLAKMFQYPLPMWDEYMWPKQATVTDEQLLIKPESVIDITSHIDKNGTLKWDAPAGSWTILYTGMTTTGMKNSPATPEATGLEVDKMSRKHTEKHFESYMGEILRRIPEADRRSFKIVVQDSYEMGSQNWTDDFINTFKKRYNYDPTPYIVSFSGRVVGTRDLTDRFLWDLRRLVADMIAYDYVGGLRDISHQYGLTTWLECYGHWGFPGEFLQYGGQSDEVAGEFWNEGTLGSIENRAASSCAHIYNKKRVWSESFTAAGRTYERYPAQLKKRGDWSFTEGINATLMHLYIQQPYEDKNPGVNAWFSTEINRKNTWFFAGKAFFDYARRCNFLLQHGRPVSDVAYYIGDDAPKMTGVADPALPQGYQFDYINGETIINNLSVKDGKWILPHGVSYRLLVMPKQETIRPEVLAKLTDLVKKGGILYGLPNTTSPSLENYPQADKEVQTLSTELWGALDVKECDRIVGQGRVLAGLAIEETLKRIGLTPDCQLDSSSEALFIHRTFDEGDIYFVTNQKEEAITLEPHFRVTGKQPELWDAVTGSMRPLKAYTFNGEHTSVPLTLQPYESAFIVFRSSNSTSGSNRLTDNFPQAEELLNLSASNWTITFNDAQRGPKAPITTSQLFDWTTSSDPLVKYYSGSATYTTSFSLNKEQLGSGTLKLDLGKVTALARVSVNGKYMGTAWTAPWSVDLTPELVEGENSLTIEVINTWCNRLAGDALLPESERTTWLTVNPFNEKSSLQPSGLVGPVKLQKFSY